MADLVEPAPPGSLTEIPSKAEKEDYEALSGSSAKIDQLLKLLQLTPSNEKSLVFSQFTSFLDKVAFPLSLFLNRYLRLLSDNGPKIEQVLAEAG